jgi:hypothetical protein
VVFSFCTLSIVTAEDQNPPYGKDKGIWVLIDTKPDVEAEKDWDNGLYYNNHVVLSGTTITGGYSWKDGDDPSDCKGTVEGIVSWNELPGALEPGNKYETTITAVVSGSQSCSARHPSACAHLEINEASMEPHPCISYNSGDPKPQPETEKVSWEVPWGKLGDNLTIGVITRVSGSIKAHVYYIYSYQAKAPAVPPNPSEMSPKEIEVSGVQQPKIVPISSEPRAKKSCEGVQKVDSGVRFSGLTGQVDIRPDCDEDAWRGAGLKSIIYIDDHIRTGEDSRAMLSFADMTTFEMKPETEIIVDTPPQMDSKMSLVMGKLWTNVKKMFKDGTMEVQMSQAVAGIKGTVIVCEETGSASTLKVLEGKAYFRSKSTGEERFVNAGESVTATMSGLSSTRSIDIDEENTNWQVPASKSEGAKESVTSKVLFNNWNHGAVENNPTCEPSFTIIEPHMITYIDTYHWNQGKGSAIGKTIYLGRDEWLNDDYPWVYQWDVQAEPGTNGVPNAWWKCYPMVVIPAGTYHVFDLDPSTWSQNSESGGCGFAKVEGYPVSSFCFWNGTWETNFGMMELQQAGEIAYGTYTHDQGRIEGTVSGDKLIGYWSESPSYSSPNDAGDFEFIMSKDCKYFSGIWRHDSEGVWEGSWNGTRA